MGSDAPEPAGTPKPGREISRIASGQSSGWLRSRFQPVSDVRPPDPARAAVIGAPARVPPFTWEWLPVRANGSMFPDPTVPRYGADPRSHRCNDPPEAGTPHPRILR